MVTACVVGVGFVTVTLGTDMAIALAFIISYRFSDVFACGDLLTLDKDFLCKKSVSILRGVTDNLHRSHLLIWSMLVDVFDPRGSHNSA